MRVRGVRGRPGKTHPTGGVRGLMQFQQLPQMHVCKPCNTKLFLIFSFFPFKLANSCVCQSPGCPGVHRGFHPHAPPHRQKLLSANDKTDKENNQRLSLFLPSAYCAPSPLLLPSCSEKNQGTISVCVYVCERGGYTSIGEAIGVRWGGVFRVMYFSNASHPPRRVHSRLRAHVRRRAAGIL